MRARILPLVALALSACVETRYVEIGSSRHLEELTEETTETQALREHAFTTWANAGAETPGDYLFGLLPTAELQVACGTPSDRVVGGCTFLDERVIFVDADASPEAQRRTIVHEVGHLAHGHHGHLPCDRTGRGPDIMCTLSMGTTLTARDIAFVLPTDESP